MDPSEDVSFVLERDRHFLLYAVLGRETYQRVKVCIEVVFESAPGHNEPTYCIVETSGKRRVFEKWLGPNVENDFGRVIRILFRGIDAALKNHGFLGGVLLVHAGYIPFAFNERCIRSP
jgi:hypothetical protein